MSKTVYFVGWQSEKTNRISTVEHKNYDCFDSLTVTITSGTSKAIQYDFVGLDENGNEVADLYWYNSNDTITIPMDRGIVTWYIWGRYSDNSAISPSDATSCTCVLGYSGNWEVGDDGLPYNELSANPISNVMESPYPQGLWRIESGEITTGLLPQADELGAFANAVNLTQVSIPRSCKKIGRYAFANTQLTSVTIASDCDYYDTSFPAGCVVNFYPD